MRNYHLRVTASDSLSAHPTLFCRRRTPENLNTSIESEKKQLQQQFTVSVCCDFKQTVPSGVATPLGRGCSLEVCLQLL